MAEIIRADIQTMAKMKEVKGENKTVSLSSASSAIIKKGYSPYIGDDNCWYEYDIESKEFVNTGIIAKGIDGEDGYTPIKDVDYFDGEDGYTPIKGVDYFDGEDGSNYEITSDDYEEIAKLVQIPEQATLWVVETQVWGVSGNTAHIDNVQCPNAKVGDFIFVQGVLWKVTSHPVGQGMTVYKMGNTVNGKAGAPYIVAKNVGWGINGNSRNFDRSQLEPNDPVVGAIVYSPSAGMYFKVTSVGTGSIGATQIFTDLSSEANWDYIINKPLTFTPSEHEHLQYLTQHQSLEGYATEEWVEDKGYINGDDVRLSDAREPLSHTHNKNDIVGLPTKVSDFINDSGFISKAVNDLENYYKKSEVNNLVDSLPKFSFNVVESLPTSNISPTAIYLIVSQTPEDNNLYEEYVHINNKWELIGSQAISLDGYATEEFVTSQGYLKSYTETDPTVPAWAKQQNKPTYSYQEITNKPVAFTPISHTHSLDDISGARNVVKLEFGIVPNTYINSSNGQQVSYVGWSSTDYVDVHGYERIETYGVGATSYCAFYDADKKYIRSVTLAQDPFETATNGAYYFRASNSSTNINRCSINGLKNDGGSYFDHFIKDDDSRLTDARTPIAHTHSINDVTDYRPPELWIVGDPVWGESGNTAKVTHSKCPDCKVNDYIFILGVLWVVVEHNEGQTITVKKIGIPSEGVSGASYITASNDGYGSSKDNWTFTRSYLSPNSPAIGSIIYSTTTKLYFTVTEVTSGSVKAKQIFKDLSPVSDSHINDLIDNKLNGVEALLGGGF